MSLPKSANLRHVRFGGARTPGRSPAMRTARSASVSRHADPPVVPGATPGAEFAAWVLARAGLDPADYRSDPLARRVPACLRALRVDSVAGARVRLETSPELLERALGAFIIGVTGFFRDAGAFETLTRTAIPALEARSGPLRVWSAGCSTGEELYSVAIQFAEVGLLDRVALLGTDCRSSAIDDARLARYAESALAELPSGLRGKYFVGHGGRWQLEEPVRSKPEWRVSDVLSATEPGPWDLALCRNLIIYLGADAAAHVIRAIAGTLAPGGFILLGKAERPPADLGLQAAGPCLYRISSSAQSH
jgi:chemotaxis protein methyltransferase CheR